MNNIIMNKITYLALIILTAFFLYTDADAQLNTRKGGYIASLEYTTTFNTGRAADYLSEGGFWGGSMEIKSFINNDLSLGVILGHSVISDQEENGSTEVKNGVISGPQARYLNYTPILATIGYFFNKGNRNKTVPFVQANIGTYYIWQRLQVGANIIDNDNWHFGMGPEVGVMFYLGNSAALTLSGRYNYAFSSGEPIGTSDDNSYSFINASIGFAYTK